ncbi:MAG: transcription antitermination factor NusB [Nitrospirae bacterium]|nr:transcription antitermination factor NusB [Nitrospirota bacterium]
MTEEDEVKEFTRDIAASTLDHRKDIDEIIKSAAENWSIERMAIIDRNILRAATYELCYRSDIPSSVAINEALEIAKKYSTEESAPFINGILDKIAHQGNKSTVIQKGQSKKVKQKPNPK